MPEPNVFVLGLHERDRQQLQALRAAPQLRFHSLLSYAEIDGMNRYRVDDLLERATRQLEAFPGRIDAVIGMWDFPITTMVPILARRFGFRSPTLESVLRCEHKHWARVEQRASVPEVVPRFTRFDAYADDVADHLEAEMGYPFWLKPIKSFESYLGFRVNDREDLERALELFRAGASGFENAFERVLAHAELPPKERGGGFGIAEGIISEGEQCTLEGWISSGEIGFHGLVDSVRVPGSSSFARYVYPSHLPARVQQRMQGVARRLMRHIGLDDYTFNIEFFWHKQTDELWLLEVNPRISQSHADLFYKVDGEPNLAPMVDVALGIRPRMRHREGRYGCAAKLFLRHFADAVVKRAPSAADIARVQARFPDTCVLPLAQAGQRLSELMHQDSYSYMLCLVWIGADDEQQVLERFDEVVGMLGFELEEDGRRVSPHRLTEESQPSV